MEVLYIFFAVLIIIPVVGLIATVRNESKTNKDKALLERLAPNDIKKIKQAMLELGITVPADSNSNTNTLRRYLNELCQYADSKVWKSLHKGYEVHSFSSALYIFYNKKQVIIPSDLFSHIRECKYSSKVYVTENGIKYFGTKEKNDGISIGALIDNVKKLDDKDFIKSNIDTVKWDDLIWYLDGVPKGHRLASVGAGAITGAVLFGAVGAVAGAVSSNNDAKKTEERIVREMKLMFGYCGGRKWVINTDWNSSSFQCDFNFLLETCPDRRGENIERSK